MTKLTQTDYRRLNLIIARTVKQMTLRELAARVGVSHTILSRLENDWRVDTNEATKAAICRELALEEFPGQPEQAVMP